MEKIESDRLLLHPLQLSNAADLIRIHSLPDVSRYQSWTPTSEAEVDTFICRMEEAEFLAPDQWFQFSILAKDGLRFVGDCGVHAQPQDHRQVEVGVTIDPEFQKQGYAREAIQTLIDFVFDMTETHRIYASIDPRNAPSIRLFESLGFRKKAHLVQSLWFKGEWADDLIMAILKKEWAKPNQASEETTYGHASS